MSGTRPNSHTRARYLWKGTFALLYSMMFRRRASDVSLIVPHSSNCSGPQVVTLCSFFRVPESMICPISGEINQKFLPKNQALPNHGCPLVMTSSNNTDKNPSSGPHVANSIYFFSVFDLLFQRSSYPRIPKVSKACKAATHHSRSLFCFCSAHLAPTLSSPRYPW